VLGANDGIVSIAGLVVGVAGASDSVNTIVTAGVAGIVAGAISMAAGEYVSVSSARDTERALLDMERTELRDYPAQELEELADIYEKRGLTPQTAHTVAEELMAHNAFEAHANAELGIDPNDLVDPWHAAFASATSFLAGAIIPLIAIAVPPAGIRIPVAFIAVLAALAVTGVTSARVGGAPVATATTRVVLGGAIAMAATFGIGKLFGSTGV
jgi:VIT1/CCC1 family predicted Fe2+/Mn2+ transporter